MKPLYDKDCNLVGWIEKRKNIYNTNLDWVAFVERGNIFAAKDCEWLGIIKNYNCIDKEGKVIAWTPKHKVKGTLKPFEPIKPLPQFPPFKPIEPLIPNKPTEPIPPIDGWSEIEWSEWIKDKEVILKI